MKTELDLSRLATDDWYHTIEISPGIWTPGRSPNNLPITRKLLEFLDLSGQRAIDLGAQDCLMSFLMERNGATCTAQDILGRHDHIAFLIEALESNLEYTDKSFQDILSYLEEPYGVVLMAGVLYHAIDPLQMILQCRGMTAPGGLVIIETSAILSDENAAYFNEAGKFFPRTNYWQVTVANLEYMLRFSGICPIAVRWTDIGERSGKQLIRCAVLGRVVETPISRDPDDEWLAHPPEETISDSTVNQRIQHVSPYMAATAAASINPVPVSLTEPERGIDLFDSCTDETQVVVSEIDTSWRQLALGATV